jgi:hypothetical protein
MKQTVILFAAILLLAVSAGAQESAEDSLPLAPVAPASSTTVTPSEPSLFAVGTAAPFAASSATSSAPGLASASGAGAASPDQQPTVYGVFQNFNWQANAGYTFYRFYVVPHVTENMNGLNLGLVYYPKGLWVGAEGEFTGTWGSVFGDSSKFVMGMGGPRFRWSGPRAIEVWGHGLIGGANFLPQTAYGNQGAFAYEVGGGIDINVHQRRFAYRVGADMVGTRFFSTYQYSPKVSISFVYKF